MRVEEIMVGDTVRFRTWDDMSKEFPVQPGRILCDKHFVAAMKGLCGSEFTVTRVRNGLIDGHNTTWKVTADMLEPAVAIPEIEESTMALETILC